MEYLLNYKCKTFQRSSVTLSQKQLLYLLPCNRSLWNTRIHFIQVIYSNVDILWKYYSLIILLIHLSCSNDSKNKGPLPKLLNSPADGTCVGGLEYLPEPLAWLVNRFSNRGHTKLLQPTGEETLVPSAGLFNVFGSGPWFFFSILINKSKTQYYNCNILLP